MIRVDRLYYAFGIDEINKAIQFMKDHHYKHDVLLYGIHIEDVAEKMNDVFQEIYDYNKGKDLDIQILPTNPIVSRGLDGCLGVCTMTIMMGTYKENHRCIPLSTTYNKKVLDTDDKGRSEIRPSLKALSSLAFAMSLVMKERDKI